MSTLRINNIEAQSIPASPTIDEKVKVTNSSGDILVNIDGKTSGITTIGINTTDGNIKFDANSNVLITGILTATTLAGNFTPDSLEIGSNIKLGNAGVITATSFVGSGANLTGVTTIAHTGANQLVIKDSDTSGDNAHMRISFQDSGGTEKFFVGNNNSNGWLYLGSPSGQNNNIAFRVNGQDKFQVNGSGAYVNGALTVAGNADIADSIIHTGDTNTKIRFPSNDNISFEVAGVERLRIDNVDGVVAKHTTAANLRVQNSTAATGQVAQLDLAPANGLSGVQLRANSEEDFSTGANRTAFFSAHVRKDGTFYERLRIDSGGRLRVGSTTESADGAFDDLIIGNHSGNRGISILSGSSSQGAIGFAKSGTLSDGYLAYNHNSTATSSSMVLKSSGIIKFNAGSVEKVRITSDGRLYIGATSGGNADTDDLVISGSGKKGITVCSTDGGETRIVFADGLSGTNAVVGQVLYDHSVNRMDFYTSTNRRASIDSSGRLLINGATSNNAFSGGDDLIIGNSSGSTRSGITIVSNSSQDGGLYFSDGTSSGNAHVQGQIVYDHSGNFLRLYTSASERLRINSSGQLIVTGDQNTNSDYGLLQVNQATDNDEGGIAILNDANTRSMRIYVDGSANSVINSGDGGGGVIVLNEGGGQVNIGTSGVLKAQINNSVNGHYFVSQCDDNNTGFEIYSQHGSTSSRNSFAVFNNSTGSKHNNFYVRGDNQVFISTNKDSVGLVMDGTSSGTAFGETGATIDFRMLNEANQFTGNPAARIASYLERGNNGFGLKFFARQSAGTFYAACQISPDYELEPCLDNGMNLGSDERTWNKIYVKNAYPDHGTEQITTGSSFASSSYYDTGFSRGSMGGLDTNGVYIITLFADTYAAGGGNYSCNYTWIVGMRNQSTNQNAGNSVPLLSVTGHSTNGVLFELRTKRDAAVHGGNEVIQWRCTANLSEINNGSGRLMRWRVQRIGRSST